MWEATACPQVNRAVSCPVGAPQRQWQPPSPSPLAICAISMKRAGHFCTLRSLPAALRASPGKGPGWGWAGPAAWGFSLLALFAPGLAAGARRFFGETRTGRRQGPSRGGATLPALALAGTAAHVRVRVCRRAAKKGANLY